MSIKELQKRVHALAKSKGWYQDVPDPKHPHWLSARIALIHSEVSEALECVRDGDLVMRTETDRFGQAKPEGLPSELADIVIRVLDFAESLDIDLEAAIETKHAFNTTRTHRHGGRAL